MMKRFQTPNSDLPPSVQEIKYIVDNLLNFKAAGLDLLFNESLKNGGPLLSTLLVQLHLDP
jgi:hypothetical protein